MESSKNKVGRARASEERLRHSIMDAVMPILGTTPARRAWLEAAFEILWRGYYPSTPLEMARSALERGDMKLYEACLADEARLKALEEAIEAEDACSK